MFKTTTLPDFYINLTSNNHAIEKCPNSNLRFSITSGILTTTELDISDSITVKDITVTQDISIGRKLKDGSGTFGSAGQAE